MVRDGALCLLTTMRSPACCAYGPIPRKRAAAHVSKDKHTFAFSQRKAPEFCYRRPALTTEGAGNAGCALHPRSRAQKECGVHARAYRLSGGIRHSLRDGFTAYALLSPATNSSCHRRRRIRGCSTRLGLGQPPPAWHQQRVSGPHGFAVRYNVVRPARWPIAHEVQLALRPPFAPTLSRPSHPVPRS